MNKLQIPHTKLRDEAGYKIGQMTNWDSVDDKILINIVLDSGYGEW